MLVRSSYGLDVLVPAGNFIGVDYTLNQMDHIKKFILMAAQLLE
jgi:hypothetical protein